MIDFKNNLVTEKIRLRPMDNSDFEKFLEIVSDKMMWIFFTSDLSNEDELEEWVKSAISQMDKNIRIPFTIVDRANEKIIGSTSFMNISERDLRVEIGATWICREYQGKGFNDHAKYLMLKYCFENELFERVEFKTDVLNESARKALERIGAIEEGVLRSHTLMTNNRRRDTIYYSILRQEWTDIKVKNNWL